MKELGYLLLAAITIVVYFLPTIIAVKRQHAYKGIIAVINVVFGLTGIGWARALILGNISFREIFDRPLCRKPNWYWYS
jgi:xanthine/uracil permease